MTVEKIACPILNKDPQYVGKTVEILVQISSINTGEGQKELPYKIMCPEYTGNRRCQLNRGTCVYSEWRSLR